MAQTRDKVEATINKKAAKVEMAKRKLEEMRKAVENADPVMVNGVDIKYCMACNSGKADTKLGCEAYTKDGQARWMRLGWCPLGSTGPNPPESAGDQSGKRRAGQQKQVKKR